MPHRNPLLDSQMWKQERIEREEGKIDDDVHPLRDRRPFPEEEIDPAFDVAAKLEADDPAAPADEDPAAAPTDEDPAAAPDAPDDDEEELSDFLSDPIDFQFDFLTDGITSFPYPAEADISPAAAEIPPAGEDAVDSTAVSTNKVSEEVSADEDLDFLTDTDTEEFHPFNFPAAAAAAPAAGIPAGIEVPPAVVVPYVDEEVVYDGDDEDEAYDGDDDEAYDGEEDEAYDCLQAVDFERYLDEAYDRFLELDEEDGIRIVGTKKNDSGTEQKEIKTGEPEDQTNRDGDPSESLGTKKGWKAVKKDS